MKYSGSTGLKFVFLILITIFPVSVPAQNTSDALTQELNRLYAGSKFPGFCVAIVDANGIAYQQGFGLADVEKKVPYSPKTIQPVGSVSKTLIGVALVKAIEQGHFSLKTNVNDLLPFQVSNPHFPGKVITIEHLATHTSTIVDREAAYKKVYVPGKKADSTIQEFLTAYLTSNGKLYQKENFARNEPGTAYNYSNIGATLAAYLIELKTGMSFASYTQRFILKPLGMDSSGWVYDDQQADNATLYEASRKVVPTYSLVTYPEGGLRTSGRDLSQYLIEIIKGYAGKSSLLTRESFQTMLSPKFAATGLPKNIDPKEPNQGIFWQFRRNGTIGHSGGDPGVTAFLSFNPKTGKGKIFLTNILIEENDLAGQFSGIWKTLESYEDKIDGQ